ncbi:MAG: leucine-rich repeat domain-containing protein [Treponema sp.]|jgi:hypothetical protein|nr:leucine-rich repeat domain-containing protein [Treponema sp.]
MKVNYRFLKLLVWGSIAFLLLVIAGCSLGLELDAEKAAPNPLSQEETEQEAGKEEQSSGENQEAQENGGEGEDENENEEEQSQGENEETPEDNAVTNYPKDKVWAAVSTISVKIDEDKFIPYKDFYLSGEDAANQKVTLPKGIYKIESHFLAHNTDAVLTETIEIQEEQKTVSIKAGVSEDDFPEPREFSSSDELKNYLKGLDDNTADNPYPVKISGADISSRENKGWTLKTLYESLNKYVTLDLRECTGTNLISASSASIEERKNIVSLILPDSITEINANGFSGYTNLKTALLPKVQIINRFAFKDCGQLKSVFAPAMIEIANTVDTNDTESGAFAKCAALETLYLPSLVTMGKYAVYGCGSLIEVSFPKLTTLGGLAFKGCILLETVSLPSVTKIGASSFEGDKALKYLILGQTTPEIETNIFKSSDFSKDGVIYVPFDSLDAYKNTGASNWAAFIGIVKPLPAAL